MEIIEKQDELKKKNIPKRNEGDKEAILVIKGVSFLGWHLFYGFIRQRARKIGVNTYFPKPLTLKEFQKILLQTIKDNLKQFGGNNV